MNKLEKTLMHKDINDIMSSKQVFLPMIIVPLVIVVIIPFAMIIGINFTSDYSSALEKIGPILKKLPEQYSSVYTSSQLLIKISLDFMFPSYFLIIPIMCSGVMGASSFVGEREHKTMESILYTPLTMEQLLRSKILGVFVPSYVVTLLSFIAFGIIMNVCGFIYFKGFIFPDLKWIIIMFWVVPGVSLLSLTFTVLVSAKSKTFQEAQQVSGFLLIPVIMILIGQVSGLIFLNVPVMILCGMVLFALDYVLIKMISSRFIPEKLI